MRTLDKQFIFVVGAPRSGTSWLHQMIAAHPKVAGMANEELTVFSRYVSPWVNNFRAEERNMAEGKWSQGLPCLFTAVEFEQRMLTFVDEVYARVDARNPGATHILDKHPNYSNHMALIDHMLPRSRFIHIIRDGREVAVSMMSARKRIGHSPGEVRGAAQEWHRCVTAAQAYGLQLGATRYMEVRYDQLFAGTATGLAEVLAFCGLEDENGFIARIAQTNHISVKQISSGDTNNNALRTQPGAIWKTRLSLRERYRFDLIAGNLLLRLGYADRGWWSLGPMDRARMLAYPLLSRMKRSFRSLTGIWGSPLEERLS